MNKVSNALMVVSRGTNPWIIFFSVFVIFYLLPTVIIFFNFNENFIIPEYTYQLLRNVSPSEKVLHYYLYAPFLFLVGYCLPVLIIFAFFKMNPIGLRKGLVEKKMSFQNPFFYSFMNLILFGGFLAVGIVLIYFFYASIGLFALLGGDVAAGDFRATLFDDRYRNINLLLEVARRIILPIVASFLMFQSLIINQKLSGKAKFFWFMLFFSGIITLDRGPVFISLALLILYTFFSTKSYKRLFFYGLVLASILILFGGLVTNLQYNVTEFTFYDLLLQGLSFLISRLFFDPAVMSLTTSFTLVDGINDPLNLEYARISALWGGNYVGSFDTNSIYVTPVSFIGDIWRNFGINSFIFFGFLISMFFLYITYLTNRAILFFRFPILFLSLIWSFYIVAGTLFSIGVFAILFLMILLPLISVAGKAK